MSREETLLSVELLSCLNGYGVMVALATITKNLYNIISQVPVATPFPPNFFARTHFFPKNLQLSWGKAIRTLSGGIIP